MKLETALKRSVNVPKGFHSRQARKLQKGLKREFSKGNDVHGERFQPLSKGYKKRKMQGIASRGQQNISGKPDMFLTGQFLNSSYFKNVKFINKNTIKMTTGMSREGTKALQHSGKIKAPSGLPVRAIVGDQVEDDVVHPKLKKEYIKAYAKRIRGHLKKAVKKEFL